MAKKRTEGRRGQGARAHRKRVQSPEARAAARELGLRLHTAGQEWREANPEAAQEAARRSGEARRANREAAGLERLEMLQAGIRPDQMDYLKARAAQCPCSLAAMVRWLIDAQIYNDDDD